eukprot:404393_1
MYLCYHVHCIPFKYKRINALEGICIVLLILVIISTIAPDTITNIFVSFAIIIPYVICFIYFILMIIGIYNSKSDTKFTKSLMKKIIQRAPVSIQFDINNINNSNNNNNNNDNNGKTIDSDDHKNERDMNTKNNTHSTAEINEKQTKITYDDDSGSSGSTDSNKW